MKTFVLKTFGCKSNQLESAVMQEKLVQAGYIEVQSVIDADIFILNSCSVTENADLDVFRLLRNVKNKNQSILTVLTGCTAQLRFDEIKNMPFVDIVLGNDDKFEILEALSSGKSCVSDIFKVEKFNHHFVTDYSKTRGYLKIQDGCNNRCSYCTIWRARGRNRSNSVDNILEQVVNFANIGVKEVVLTGIHIGQWGHDFNPKLQLLDLLKVIENTDIQRYRLGSLNVLELNDELLSFLSSSKKFCPHFHLSIQSLCDKTLKAMNRNYSADDCLLVMQKISEMFDRPFIGSDIIVGFPEESDRDFDTTLNNVLKSHLSAIHVFPYSVRNNTVAANMVQVEDSVKVKRADILRNVAQDKFFNFVQCNIGSISSVLVEKKLDKNTGFLKGVTQNYLNVLLNSKDISLCNTIQNVKILSFDSNKKLLNVEICNN
jgi:threonylcarbamoyladenosine tRNA methylthiotransferase MtaB